MDKIIDLSELLSEQEITKAMEVPERMLSYPVITSNFSTPIGELMRPMQRMAREMCRVFKTYRQGFDIIGYLIDRGDVEKANKVLCGLLYYIHNQEGNYKRRKCNMRRK